MNIFKDRWPQFKEEWPTLAYLTVVQIWLSFNWPVFVRLGSPFNIVVPVLVSIACTIFHTYVLLFPECLVRQMSLEFFDDFPDPVFFKRMHRAFMVAIFHLVYLYMWYIDCYRMPTIWYFVSYVYSVITYMLIYNAVKKHFDNKTY